MRRTVLYGRPKVQKFFCGFKEKKVWQTVQYALTKRDPKEFLKNIKSSGRGSLSKFSYSVTKFSIITQHNFPDIQGTQILRI